ncbi:UbiA prenyltransferase family protein [Kitasatospora griseola]|uniref:hypothetical protein n=1 Tax=Kitasatospora griseola TaxID=2064 RepID=UPI00380C04A6
MFQTPWTAATPVVRPDHGQSAFVTPALPGHPWPAGRVMVAAALLGTGARVTEVLPDTDGGPATDVRGLPQRLGPRPARVLVAVLLLAGAFVLVPGTVRAGRSRRSDLTRPHLPWSSATPAFPWWASVAAAAARGAGRR